MLGISAAMIFPVMAFVAGAANPIVRLLLTDKWLPAVPIIQIFCISCSINVVSNANMQSFNAIGHSDVFLISEIIKRGITILLVIVLSHIDFYLMLISIAMMGFVSLTINGFFNDKYIDYHTKSYLSDLLPSFVFSLVLFGAVYACNFFIPQLVIRLGIQIIISVVMYIVMAQSKLIKPCTQVWGVVLGLIKRKKENE